MHHTLRCDCKYTADAIACPSSSQFFVISFHVLDRYPIVVGSMGMLTSSIAAFIACKVLRYSGSSSEISAAFYCRHMVPVGVAMAITVWSGNLVYVYLTVSFTQMLKAADPVFVMIAMFLAGLERPTAPLVVSVLTICGGLLVASAGEMQLDVLGVGVMMISEVGEAVRLVLTQILLQDLQLGPLDGLLYLVGSQLQARIQITAARSTSIAETHTTSPLPPFWVQCNKSCRM